MYFDGERVVVLACGNTHAGWVDASLVANLEPIREIQVTA
jgi:hypothetical protein